MKQLDKIIFCGSIIVFFCIGTKILAQETADSTLIQWESMPTMELPDWQKVGAASKIEGNKLFDYNTTNVMNTLFGRIPGLTVQESGAEPGADSPALNSRGVGTFGSGTGLFVVVDGFPSTEEFLSRMTPSEIESIELLKDAAATAIYGNRAANGVLSVKTRHGDVSSPLLINCSVKVGFQKPIRLPDWLGSYDYATLYNEALANEGKSARYSQSELDSYAAGDSPLLYSDINWYDEILRKTSPVYDYNLTATGGIRSVRYFVSFNGVNNVGLLRDPSKVNDFAKAEKFSRYNFRTNVDVMLTRRLTASIILGGSIEDKATPGVSETTWNIMDLAATVPPNAFPVMASESYIGGNATFANPIAEMTERGYISYNGRTAQASLRLNERLDFITPGLSVSGAVSFNNYYKSYSNKTRNYVRYSPVKDSSGEVSLLRYGEDTELTGSESDSYQWRNFVVDAFVNYDRLFGGRHYLKAVAKVDYDEYTISSDTLPFKNLGFSGLVSYSFAKKYIAEFTCGYHGNDNFPSGSRFGFFPSGGLSWIVSEEGFLKDNPILDFLKLKATYGMVGNSNIGGSRWMFNQYYNWNGYYYFGSTNTPNDTYVESAKANPYVTWEKSSKLNLGLEAKMLDNLYGCFDYFIERRKNILTQPYASIPDYVGFSRPNMNLGKVKNQGFEAVLGYDKSSGGFQYKVEASAWYAHNKITYNSESPQVYKYLYSTGRIVGQPFVLEAVGFFKNQEDIEESPTQIWGEVFPGDIKYKDQNGDKVINEEDRYPIGRTSRPEITLGLDLEGKYKGFDVQLFFQGALRRTVYLDGKPFQAFQNNGKITDFALGRWTSETADKADYPRLSTTGNMNNFQYSSFWQRNGDFFKLRYASLGYTIKSGFMKKANIDGLRIFVCGTNLFSLDHMHGYCDPEVLYGYPSVSTCSLGINVNF